MIFVGTGAYPNLRDTFALPLRWRAGQANDSQLPAALRHLADRVRHAAGVFGWGLGYADAVAGSAADLSELDLLADSGWVPLYGGLRLAQDDLQPRPDVWATGAWDDDRGVTGVDGVANKSAFARELGVRQLFVPAGEEESVTRAGLEAGTLARLGNRRLDAVDEYLLTMGAPPAAPDLDDPEELRDRAFRRCRAYWQRLPRDRAATFFQTHLLPEVVRRCRAQVRNAQPGWEVATLVTIVSGSPELVEIAAGATLARRVVLLYTGDGQYADLAARAGERLAHHHAVEVVPFEGGEDGMEDALAQALAGLGLSPLLGLAFDLTPGSKRMTLALDRMARERYPGAALIYLGHKVVGGRPDPDTIKLLRWAAS